MYEYIDDRYKRKLKLSLNIYLCIKYDYFTLKTYWLSISELEKQQGQNFSTKINSNIFQIVKKQEHAHNKRIVVNI